MREEHEVAFICLLKDKTPFKHNKPNPAWFIFQIRPKQTLVFLISDIRGHSLLSRLQAVMGT